MKTSFFCRTARPARVSRFHCVLAGFVLLGLGARAATFSGNVRDDGLNLGGVRVEYLWSGPVTGGSGSVTTDGNGNWSSSGWGPLTTVVFGPSQAGYSFSPPSRTVKTDIFGGGSQSGLNFERISYSISGIVTRGGVGLGGVIVTLSGPLTPVSVTASDGSFSFLRLPSGTYTITPSRPGTVFAPANRTVTLSPSQTAQNFSILLPTVTTLAATDVAFGDAVLNGRFEGEGTLATSVWFEYGTGGAFDSVTPTQVFAPGSVLLPVSAAVSGLSGGVTYNFRLVGANNNGTNYGAIQTFVMPFPPALTAVNLDGINDYVQVASNPFPGVTNTFTIELWVNPTATRAATPETVAGTFGVGLQRYAVFPDHGDNGYGAGHAGAGLSIGSNGISVFEHGANYLPSLLVYSNSISDWTHVALVYVNRQPQLYVNGTLVRTGLTSTKTFVHASANLGGSAQAIGYGNYQGQLDEVRIWNVARSATDIQSGLQRRLFGTEPGLVAYYQFNV
ncbi:MAG: hypothetical protein DME24_06245, partial [Verrucomicrobia bacterium]